MTTEQETQEKLSEKAGEKSTEKPSESGLKKPPTKSAAKKRRPRKKKTIQCSYDHIPIIIALLVVFSITLFGIGIGLTRYLKPERAGIPACGKVPCPSPFSAPQKGGGE